MRREFWGAWTGPVVVLAVAQICQGQAEQQKHTLIVNGQSGEATLIQANGRSYVDLETLARIGKGSVGFQGNQIVLTLPASAGSTPAATPASPLAADPGFSRDFMSAGIEVTAVIREWRSALANAIQNGYPISANWVAGYRGRAEDSLSQASVAASTASDQSALQLLTSESENVRKWSDSVVHARKSMDAKFMSPNALQDDPQFQKILSCAHLLAPMLASGKFQDIPSCH